MLSDNERAEQLVKQLRDKRAHDQRNSYEIGDPVSTCTGHTGVVRSYNIMDNGDRYYHVQILDEGSMKFEHQSGTWMSHLPVPEDILGDEYFK